MNLKYDNGAAPSISEYSHNDQPPNCSLKSGMDTCVELHTGINFRVTMSNEDNGVAMKCCTPKHSETSGLKRASYEGEELDKISAEI